MATHNSLFSDKDVRRHPDAIAVSVQLPWYRSLWLSAVDDVAASVNGVAVPKDDAALRAERHELPHRGAARAVGHALVRRRQARGRHPAGPRPRGGREARPSRSSSPCACCTCRSCPASTAAPAAT